MKRLALETAGAVVLGVLAWLWWRYHGELAPVTADWVVLGAVAAGFAVFFVSSRQPEGALLRLGVFASLLALAAAETWFTFGLPIADGRLRLSTADMWLDHHTRHWLATAALLAPVPGIILGATQTADCLVAALAVPRRLAGDRRRAKSSLYGKADFMGRGDRRRLSRGAGLLLGQAGPKARSPLIAWPLEGSAITVAPPRTGKGATIALNLLSPGGRGPQGSTILIDPRGETFCVVARRRRLMGRRVILVDPFGMVRNHAGQFKDLHLPSTASARYNPLDFIREEEEHAVKDIGVLLDALLTPPASENHATSQHFHASAREIIGGYIAWVRFQEDPPERNLARVRELVSQSGEPFKRFARRVRATGPFCAGMAKTAVDRRLSVGDEEAGSQASTIANQLSFLTLPEICRNTEASTFDPACVSDGNTDIFVVVPDDMIDQVKGWLRMWITIPNAVPNRRALKRDMLLIIDEMPRLGFLKPVMDAYNLAAGKGIHFWCFAQSISALDSSWGREPRKTLIDLAEVVQILGFPRADAAGAEEFAKAIGQATFESASQSRSGTVSEQRVMMASSQIQTGESTQLVREYLVQPDELMTMGPDQQYVIAASKAVSRNALAMRHARYWRRPDARAFADPNPFVLRKELGALHVTSGPRRFSLPRLLKRRPDKDGETDDAPARGGGGDDAPGEGDGCADARGESA
ncbi:MAG: type IV secretory system conjugative DNA transfer family protein [bacterium]|nr:type IV secretory system conjugative DNA transfer family protein [bacterium]MDE0417616.1 type IV secretory system conjugative DNA transfer family protein [bacterium]